MRITPTSEIEIDIITGPAFEDKPIKAKFTIAETIGGGIEITSDEGKFLKVSVEGSRQLLRIDSVDKIDGSV